MKEWILYCVLCSLIYAMSVQAYPANPPSTAEVVFWNNKKLPVLDCALFVPELDKVFGKNLETDILKALKAKGFTPTQTPFLVAAPGHSQSDSSGHSVTTYFTYKKTQALDRNGKNSLYLTVTGLKSTIKKKHKFTFRVFVIGRDKEIVKTIQIGTLGQNQVNITELPRCQPQKLN